MGYRQLTQTQRYLIHARHGLGMSQRQIARELRRNATASGYDPEQAQSLSETRSACRRRASHRG
nr:helix-turn-helix domain-containing protein [Halomonas salipaludis]